MSLLKIIKNWSDTITETIAVLLVLLFLLQILMGQTYIPFIGSLSSTELLVNISKQLSSSGAAGIIFVWVLYSIYSKYKD